jgi:hypothetical protein
MFFITLEGCHVFSTLEGAMFSPPRGVETETYLLLQTTAPDALQVASPK